MLRFSQDQFPLVCPDCGNSLVFSTTRSADPWPEEGTLYRVDIYRCPNEACSYSQKSVEHWPELPN